MATIAVQLIPKTGLENPTQSSAAGGGDQFTLKDVNDIFWVDNTSGSSRNVTFVSQQVVDGSLAVADRVVTVTPGDDLFVSDLDPNVYRDSNGYCQVTYDDNTGLDVAHLRSAGA